MKLNLLKKRELCFNNFDLVIMNLKSRWNMDVQVISNDLPLVQSRNELNKYESKLI